MRILHICTGFPISYNGGITNYVRNLAEIQNKNGDDVIVLSSPDKTTSNFKVLEYSNWYIKPFTCRYRKSFISYKRIERIIKKLRPDIVHIHMMLDIDVRLYKILKKYNIKYIVSLHDYSFLCPRIQMFKEHKNCDLIGEKCAKCASFVEQTFFINKFFKLFKIDSSKFLKYSPNFIKSFSLNKKLLENAKLLLPVSTRVMEIYKNNGIKNKYEVLHIGNITADTFRKYNPKKRNQDDKIKIVMLGNFSEIKGGNEYIKLSKNLSHEKFEFHFLGRSSEEEKTAMLKNEIIDEGIYKQKDLPIILKKYDFGCVLSIWEDNAPQVVMELLNNNIPVIGTEMGGIPDFIKNEENGFLYNPYDNNTFDRMIGFIKKLNPNDIENMKKNIKHTTTPEDHFNQINKIYKSIIKEK